MSDASDARSRVLDAAYRCVARFGFAKTTMADVAREAGASRATVYRVFPGGRDEMFSAMVAAEMDRFFSSMAVAVEGAPDCATVIERALVYANRSIRDDHALQKVLTTEPERLLELMHRVQDRILDDIVGFLQPAIAAEVAAGRARPGTDVDAAARFVARMGLSLMATPGRFDLDDPAVVADLVQHELLGGILDPSVDTTGASPERP